MRQSWPATATVPASGRSSPSAMCSAVDLPSLSITDPMFHSGPRPRERSNGTTPKLHNGNPSLSLCGVAQKSGGATPHYRGELLARCRAEALVGAIHMSLDGANRGDKALRDLLVG
jgi:hypothetical protein